MINIQYDDSTVLNALSNLEKAVSNLSPVMRSIGEELTESTKQRFSDTQAPDGTDWALNTPATLEYKLGDTPLTGETGVLAETINYQLPNNNAVEIGSPLEYAAMQQFGGTKSEFPHLWGDIPERPFLGVSSDDKTEILDIITEQLEKAIK